MTDEGDPSGGALGERACCLSCGYLLRGLPRPVCPECGRAFDPLDSKTFGTGPDSRVRRKWLIRGAMGLAVGLLLVPLFPRGYSKSTITFVCTMCGSKIAVDRWEVYPADWSRLRFPGYSSKQTSAAASASTQPSTPCRHDFDVTVAAKFSEFTFQGVVSGGGVSASGNPGPGGGAVVFNGVAAGSETAGDVLRALAKRDPDGGFGVSVTEKPGRSDTATAPAVAGVPPADLVD